MDSSVILSKISSGGVKNSSAGSAGSSSNRSEDKANTSANPAISRSEALDAFSEMSRELAGGRLSRS